MPTQTQEATAVYSNGSLLDEHKMDVVWPVLNGIYPAVIYVHGGNWTNSYGQKEVGLDICRHIASQFWVACTINFRTGYPDNVNDIRTAIDFVKGFQCVDPNSVVLIGESSGAHLASLVTFMDKNVSAVISNCGLYNLIDAEHAFVTGGIEMMLGSTYEENPSLWSQASPYSYVSSGLPLVYVTTSDTDLLMPSESARHLESALSAYGADFKHHVDREADHTFQSNRAYLFNLWDVYLAHIRERF